MKNDMKVRQGCSASERAVKGSAYATLVHGVSEQLSAATVCCMTNSFGYAIGPWPAPGEGCKH